MQVAGEFRFKGAREQVWALLNDEAVLKRCTPGCERLEKVGEDEYAATVKIGLAAIKGTYQGSLKVTDKQELSSMTLKVDATGSGGFVNISGRMDLAEEGEATRLVYDWDVQMGGPVAMAGQRVLGGVAKYIIGDFFNSAQKELTARQAG